MLQAALGKSSALSRARDSVKVVCTYTVRYKLEDTELPAVHHTLLRQQSPVLSTIEKNHLEKAHFMTCLATYLSAQQASISSEKETNKNKKENPQILLGRHSTLCDFHILQGNNILGVHMQ